MTFKIFLLTTLCSISLGTLAQIYPPPAGFPGTTAVHKDSALIINWATKCVVTRGLLDISKPLLGYASSGDSSLACGMADGTSVSLGDGGYAVMTFEAPLKNGPGYDFAVFENSFDGQFLELAFVEVSSNGVDFFRFKSHSLTDNSIQTPAFGTTDATKINNLAGKYKSLYGTPFDLQELEGSVGLNVNAVTHVKVIDIVGTIDIKYASRDGYGNIINDPWPTDFPSAGFDLDAVGVIHQAYPTILREPQLEKQILIFPNPLKRGNSLTINEKVEHYEISDFTGKQINMGNTKLVNTLSLANGLYWIKMFLEDTVAIQKLIIE
jgi:hypothetical protein